MKQLLEDHVDELGRIITLENGKTFAEGKAELRRAIENVEVACGIPTMMQGYNLEDVARGVDEMMIRQPLGVVAAITPFNFPGMIPFWFLPYAIATGNTFVLKPSERVPLTMMRAFELLKLIGLPNGVVTLVNGGKEVVDALLDLAPLAAWYDRIVGLGHGRPSEMDSQEAFERARQAAPMPVTHLSPDGDPGGLKAGCPVTVTPDENARVPVHGRLVAAGPDELVIHRHDADAGDLHIHFPRMGFDVRAA